MPPKLPPDRQWLQPVRSGWEWIKYWNIEAILIAIVIFTPTLIIAVKANNWANWTGLGSNESVSITTTTRDVDGNVIETQTTTSESGKTLWDWLGLLGVPLTLAIFGYVLQRRENRRERKAAEIRDEEKIVEERRVEALAKAEKKRIDAFAKAEKKRAEAIEKEESLQLYFDRVSVLLIDKNLLLFVGNGTANNVEKNLLDVGLNIVRARTLAILRRLEDDSIRKGSVIAFLAETNILRNTGSTLANANVGKADLKNVDLSYSNFESTNFSKACFLGSILHKTSFRNANLEDAKFILSDIKGVDFTQTHLKSAHLDFSDFTNVRLDATNFHKAHLYGIDFTKADIWDNPLFSGAFLCHSNFKGLNLIEWDFSGADLRSADFSGTSLYKANLLGAKLDKADFSEANFSGADLADSTLSFAKLRKTNLYSASLWRAKLYKTSLEFALIIKTDLDDADVKGAKFEKTILINVDLRGVKNLTLEQLEKCYICGVKLPSNITDISPYRDCFKLFDILIQEYQWSSDTAEKIISDSIN